MTTVLVAFLVAHGLLHLAIWIPQPAPTAAPPPFHPDHSPVLTAVHAPRSVEHQLAIALATVTAATYLLAAVTAALGDPWTATVAMVAALAGLALKVLYAHPWLLLGVALDVLVLTSASTGWPVTL